MPCSSVNIICARGVVVKIVWQLVFCYADRCVCFREKHFAHHNARHGYADRQACFAALQLNAGNATYWQKHEGRADTQCTHTTNSACNWCMLLTVLLMWWPSFMKGRSPCSMRKTRSHLACVEYSYIHKHVWQTRMATRHDTRNWSRIGIRSRLAKSVALVVTSAGRAARQTNPLTKSDCNPPHWFESGFRQGEERRDARKTLRERSRIFPACLLFCPAILIGRKPFLSVGMGETCSVLRSRTK
jgi:hypothetical protein